MIGYNLYYVPRDQHPETGDAWEGEPVFLHLSYSTWAEAEAARRVLKTLYHDSGGHIEIDVRSAPNTHMPGEGA
jgi:hypothetical protein